MTNVGPDRMNGQTAKILIVEDEEPLTLLLRYNLEAEGYAVDSVARGDEAELRLREAVPDLVLLDWMLPGLSGIELCRRIRLRRETERLPVIMLTARGEEGDRVRGLATGADDYITKPFSVPELLARVRALLRRAKPDDDGDETSALTLGDLRMEPNARRVWRAGREIELSKTEFDLLELLIRNQGIVLDHTTIYERIWGYDFGPDSKNLAVYISYLRRKLEEPGESKLIHTVRGVGYTARAD